MDRRHPRRQALTRSLAQTVKSLRFLSRRSSSWAEWLGAVQRRQLLHLGQRSCLFRVGHLRRWRAPVDAHADPFEELFLRRSGAGRTSADEIDDEGPAPRIAQTNGAFPGPGRTSGTGWCTDPVFDPRSADAIGASDVRGCRVRGRNTLAGHKLVSREVGWNVWRRWYYHAGVGLAAVLVFELTGFSAQEVVVASALVLPVLFGRILGSWGRTVGQYLPSTAGGSSISSGCAAHILTPGPGSPSSACGLSPAGPRPVLHTRRVN